MMLQLLAVMHHVMQAQPVVAKIILRGNKGEGSWAQSEEEVIVHARGSDLQDLWLDDAVGARSLRRLMGRLGKPLAERSRGDWSIEESRQAQQIP